MLIRLATHADIPQIIDLERQADTAAHWNARDYDSLFAAGSPQRIALVACEETQAQALAGFLIARCLPGEWEIENTVTAFQRRRTGVASGLLRALLDRARDGAATSVLLEVRESNVPALRLYKRLGFVLNGRRRAYYRNPDEDALLLRFVLQPDDNLLEPE